MPLHLAAAPADAGNVQWRLVLDSGGAHDKVLVLAMPLELFSRFPGLRSAREGWSLDISHLPLMRHTIPATHWLPRVGRFPAHVAQGESGGYLLTVQF